MDKDKVKQIVEVLIFAADVPLPVNQIKSFIENVSVREIKKAVSNLNLEYTQTNRSFQIVEVAGGYQMVSRDSFAPWLRKFFQKRIRSRLSQAALESLSVIAFNQPISKSNIEIIRGVNCDGVVKTLLDRKLVTIVGRADGPGRPLLYATTREFLRYFGVNELSDLPKPREIEEILKEDNVLPEGLAETVDLTQLDPSKMSETSSDSINVEKNSNDQKEKEPDLSEKENQTDAPDTKIKKGEIVQTDHAAE